MARGTAAPEIGADDEVDEVDVVLAGAVLGEVVSGEVVLGGGILGAGVVVVGGVVVDEGSVVGAGEVDGGVAVVLGAMVVVVVVEEVVVDVVVVDVVAVEVEVVVLGGSVVAGIVVGVAGGAVVAGAVVGDGVLGGRRHVAVTSVDRAVIMRCTSPLPSHSCLGAGPVAVAVIVTPAGSGGTTTRAWPASSVTTWSTAPPPRSATRSPAIGPPGPDSSTRTPDGVGTSRMVHGPTWRRVRSSHTTPSASALSRSAPPAGSPTGWLAENGGCSSHGFGALG